MLKRITFNISIFVGIASTLKGLNRTVEPSLRRQPSQWTGCCAAKQSRKRKVIENAMILMYGLYFDVKMQRLRHTRRPIMFWLNEMLILCLLLLFLFICVFVCVCVCVCVCVYRYCKPWIDHLPVSKRWQVDDYQVAGVRSRSRQQRAPAHIHGWRRPNFLWHINVRNYSIVIGVLFPYRYHRKRSWY